MLAPKLCFEALILNPFIQPLLLSAYTMYVRPCTRCCTDVTGGGSFLVGPTGLFGATEV